jgi:hypothetical protein
MPLQTLAATQFAGMHHLEPENDLEKPLPEEVDDDVEAEQQAHPGLAPSLTPAGSLPGDLEQLHSNLLNASKGVTEETDAEYKRQVAAHPGPFFFFG